MVRIDRPFLLICRLNVLTLSLRVLSRRLFIVVLVQTFHEVVHNVSVCELRRLLLRSLLLGSLLFLCWLHRHLLFQLRLPSRPLIEFGLSLLVLGLLIQLGTWLARGAFFFCTSCPRGYRRFLLVVV